MSPDRLPETTAADGPRIALVYFGITRSLPLTLGSIRQNLVGAARAVTPTLRQFGHFYRQDRIENPRSGEIGPLDPEQYRLLDLDEVELEAPGVCLANYGFDRLKLLGDYWDDGFVSLRNLVHQLHSLKRATLMALAWRPDLVVFARPDLFYHGSIEAHLRAHIRQNQPRVTVPDWASWRGFNDRFAIVQGEAAIRVYGLRADRIWEFCANGQQLHSERFLHHALSGHDVQTQPIHASRVRSNGTVVVEDFTPGRGSGIKRTVISYGAFQRSLAGVGPDGEGLLRHA